MVIFHSNLLVYQGVLASHCFWQGIQGSSHPRSLSGYQCRPEFDCERVRVHHKPTKERGTDAWTILGYALWCPQLQLGNALQMEVFNGKIEW